MLVHRRADELGPGVQEQRMMQEAEADPADATAAGPQQEQERVVSADVLLDRPSAMAVGGQLPPVGWATMPAMRLHPGMLGVPPAEALSAEIVAAGGDIGGGGGTLTLARNDGTVQRVRWRAGAAGAGALLIDGDSGVQ